MNSNNFASIARKKLTAGEMRFARKWGAVAVILASLLTLSIVMLIAGQYASSRSDIEGFILKDETLVSTRADYDKQKIKVDEKQAQLKAEEDVKAALTNERESLLVKRAEAIEAIAEKNTDTLTDINAEISRLNEDIKAADAVIESLAADKNVFSANIKIIEDTFSFLEKARTSITRKALTQQTNSLTACTDAIAALSEDEDANSEDIQALNALKDQLAQEIAAFEASIQAIQVENAALLEEAVREDRTSLQEIESKINDAEETKKALAEQLSAVSVNLSDILENLALADEGIQSLDKTLLGLNQSIEAADAKVQTLSRESSDEAIELNRLRILYTNAEIAVNNIGISRFLAYVRMALTSPVYVAPLAAAVLAIAAFLLIRFRFFSRAAASYQTRLGDESKKRIRSSIVLMFVLALLIAIALTLLSTGEYDRAGERLNGYAARSQAVTDAEAQVKKAKTSLDNYTQLTSLLENEEFSGKGELNSKQKSIYNKALKSAGLKESQITKGAENRAENAQLLIDIILTESKGEEAELTEAKLQLEKAESE
ncbi:MAG: hypothetical protein IJC48_01775 [Clostridia bacterium]|nr:hypothetical protein [Clostridia bacterium]